jgi:hypothetical protein
MLGRLTLPPRLVAQVITDIHDLAEGLRSLTERGDRLPGI